MYHCNTNRITFSTIPDLTLRGLIQGSLALGANSHRLLLEINPLSFVQHIFIGHCVPSVLQGGEN